MRLKNMYCVGRDATFLYLRKIALSVVFLWYLSLTRALQVALLFIGYIVPIFLWSGPHRVGLGIIGPIGFRGEYQGVADPMPIEPIFI